MSDELPPVGDIKRTLIRDFLKPKMFRRRGWVEMLIPRLVACRDAYLPRGRGEEMNISELTQLRQSELTRYKVGHKSIDVLNDHLRPHGLRIPP
jgi:hypothetical protein